jgi:hypothetical protein
VLVTVVVIATAVAGVVAGGPAAALEGQTGATFPHEPGSSAQVVVPVGAEEGDAIVADGLDRLTVDFGADRRFDGTATNVSSVDVFVQPEGNGTQRQPVTDFTVNGSGSQLTVTFADPARIDAGDDVVLKAYDFASPTAAGTYTASVTATTPDGATDGPISVSYRIARASLSFPNQSASQFGSQNVTVSGVVPNRGYVGVFRTAENGSRGALVGSVPSGPARYNERNYTVSLGGSVAESQRLVAVPFYESQGTNLNERAAGTFDPEQDVPLTNDGQSVNATGFVSVVDADARVQAGTEYPGNTRLYFDPGQPNAGYQVRAVEDGALGGIVTQFSTDADGSAVIDAGQLGQGQYTITPVANPDAVVSLDDDSTTSPADDSFFVTGGTAATAATTAGDGVAGGNVTADPSGRTAGDGPATATEGEAGDGDATAGGVATTDGAGGGDDEDGDGGSSVFGPGLGVTGAILALLAAALIGGTLLARRRGGSGRR